jgi:hypothetical protein
MEGALKKFLSSLSLASWLAFILASPAGAAPQ